MSTRSKLERKLQEEIRKDLEERGALVLLSEVLKKGFPDLMVLYKGETHFLELKREKGGRVGYYQAIWMLKLENQGFRHNFIRTFEEYKEATQWIDSKKHCL